MSEAEEIGKTRHGLEGSPDAQAVGEILHTFHEDLAKFRRECSKNMQELDKMVADFRAKSRENTTNVTSLAEQTATFLLDSCQKDHNRARQVYQLFEEVGRILREFAGESDRHAQELARMFGEFYGRDVDRKEEILQLCGAAYAFLETLRRKRHERREDIVLQPLWAMGEKVGGGVIEILLLHAELLQRLAFLHVERQAELPSQGLACDAEFWGDLPDAHLRIEGVGRKPVALGLQDPARGYNRARSNQGSNEPDILCFRKTREIRHGHLLNSGPGGDFDSFNRAARPWENRPGRRPIGQPWRVLAVCTQSVRPTTCSCREGRRP